MRTDSPNLMDIKIQVADITFNGTNVRWENTVLSHIIDKIGIDVSFYEYLILSLEVM